MSNKKLKKAMQKAQRNIQLFDSHESGSVRIGKHGQTSSVRGIKQTKTKKGYRGATQKRSKPKSTTIKKTQAATKTYTPKKKTYSKPELTFGKEPRPDLHVYGPFDGLFSGRGHAGVSGGLNRCERVYPGTFAILKQWVDEGRITWKDVQDSFAQYYFDERNEDGTRYEYLLNPYEIFSSGYQNFMVNISGKAGLEETPVVEYQPIEGDYDVI